MYLVCLIFVVLLRGNLKGRGFVGSEMWLVIWGSLTGCVLSEVAQPSLSRRAGPPGREGASYAGRSQVCWRDNRCTF